MRRRNALEISLGLVAGFFVGLLATIVHAGPVDMPVVGLVLACAIVASGAWFTMEMGWIRAWLAATVGVVAAAVWLLMFSPGDDVFVSADQWVSVVWLLLAPLSAVFPAIWTARSGDQ